MLPMLHSYPSETKANAKTMFKNAQTAGGDVLSRYVSKQKALREKWNMEIKPVLETIGDEIEKLGYQPRFCRVRMYIGVLVCEYSLDNRPPVIPFMQSVILGSSLPPTYKAYMYVSFSESWNEAVEYVWYHTTGKELCHLTLRFLL